MRPVVVVIVAPGGKHLAGVRETGEDRLVETLVTQPGIEALDKPVLLRLAWRDVMPFDRAVGRTALRSAKPDFDQSSQLSSMGWIEFSGFLRF